MTTTGRGNVMGLHWSKQNTEEFIRAFCKKNHLEVKQYNLDYNTAREIASEIHFTLSANSFLTSHLAHLGTL